MLSVWQIGLPFEDLVEEGANENKGSLFTPGICHGPGQCLFKDHIFLFLDQNRTWLILENKGQDTLLRYF